MLTLFVGGTLFLGLLFFLKTEHFDPDKWADRKEYLKFWQDMESWKTPVRWN
jgi:hypothetical protein